MHARRAGQAKEEEVLRQRMALMEESRIQRKVPASSLVFFFFLFFLCFSFSASCLMESDHLIGHAPKVAAQGAWILNF